MKTTKEIINNYLTPEDSTDNNHVWEVETKDGGSTSYESLTKDIFDDVDWFFEEYEGSYQGDFYMLGKKDNEYYFLTMSYGSCSGCDWLQGINDKAELEKLLNKIETSVVIKNREDMREFLSKYNFNDWLDDDERVEKKLRKSFEDN